MLLLEKADLELLYVRTFFFQSEFFGSSTCS